VLFFLKEMKTEVRLTRSILVVLILGSASCTASPFQSVATPTVAKTPTPSAQTETPTTISPSPTVTPIACLYEGAEPLVLPPRQTPLEVRLISDGNLWVWEEEIGVAQQISDTRDAQSFSFSPDGKVIAFTRGIQHRQIELWGIHRDGTNLQPLISEDQLHTLAGEPSTTEHPYLDEVVYLEWIDETHKLGFEISRGYQAIGGCCESGGYWQVDVDTGEISAWSPPPELVETRNAMPSPDGSQIAVINDSSVDLMNADGTNLRDECLSIQDRTFSIEGGGVIYPRIEWAADSQSLLAITFNGDLYSAESTTTTWRIPLDGSSSSGVTHFLNAVLLDLSFTKSGLSSYTKSASSSRAMIIQLHLAAFDGAKGAIYTAMSNVEFLHWHPDSYHFVYEQWNVFRPFLGSVCGEAIPLLDNADTPATQIQWVDSSRFLYAEGWLDLSIGLARVVFRANRKTKHLYWSVWRRNRLL
jgi:hypothetical protein